MSGSVIKGEKESKVQKGTPKKRLITFWEDGFTIDCPEDTRREPPELRSYENPNNRALLQAIQQGKAPLKELKVATNEPVNVQVVHKMNEKYKAHGSDETSKTFSGAARKLNEEAAPIEKNSPPKAKEQVEQPTIDSSQSTVSHQLRFSDGRRINATFNTNSSLFSLFDYARKMSGLKKVRILAGHPPAEVQECEGTLEACGLAKGSVLTIRPA